MNWQMVGVMAAIAFGIVTNAALLITFRVELEHRLTKIETKLGIES